MKKLGDSSKLKEIKVSSNNTEDSMKHYDLIHSYVGEKPQQINNNMLEGEYQEILEPELVENMDYVLVSEKVWEQLKMIYEGFPAFRRTGLSSIELHPKTVRIFSMFFKGKIDYSTELIREVSNYLDVQSLL